MNARGFTLLEMVVVTTVIAILSVMVIPIVTRPFAIDRANQTVTMMGQIEQGINGREEYGDPGFIGTMGRLPSQTAPNGPLGELLTQVSGDTLVSTTRASSPADIPEGLPVGWNGPYYRSYYQNPLVDAWGTPFLIELSTSDTTQWRMRSYGPDRTFNTIDDIVVPSVAGQTNNNTNQFFFLSQGQILVDVFASYGEWQQQLTAVQSANGIGYDVAAVKVWVPDGLSGSTLVARSCTPVANVPTGGTLLPFQTWACGGAADTLYTSMIPFGIHSLEVVLSPQAKAQALYGPPNGPIPNWSYYQNFVHQRLTTYVKAVIPMSQANPYLQYEPFYEQTTWNSTVDVTTTLPAAGGVTSINQSTAGPFSIPMNQLALTTTPPLSQEMTYNVTASGIIQAGSDASTQCLVWVQYTTPGNMPIPGTPINVQQAQNGYGGSAAYWPPQYGAWIADGTASEQFQQPFNINVSVELPAAQVPTFTLVGESFGAKNCVVAKANLWISESLAQQ